MAKKKYKQKPKKGDAKKAQEKKPSLPKTAVKSKTTKNRKHQIDNFSREYPTLDKIPVINRLFRIMYHEGWWYSISLLLIGLLFLSFGMNHLGKFMTTDETAWLHVRIPQYWEALKNGDWEKTQINDKPGITPSILAGLTNLFTDMSKYSPTEIENYFFWWRFPILIFNFITLFIIYTFLKKIRDQNQALITTGIIAFTPLILGMSQIVNPDSVLWNTGFLSILSFILYVKKGKRKHSILSGVFLALALLSKFAGTIIYVLLFIFLYFEYLFKNLNRQEFLKRSSGFLVTCLISMITYAILCPAGLVDLKFLIEKTIYNGYLRKGYHIFYILIGLIYLEAIAFKGNITGFVIKKADLQKIILIGLSLIIAGIITFLIICRVAFPELLSELLSGRARIKGGETIPSFIGSFNAILGTFNYVILSAFFITYCSILISKFRNVEIKHTNIIIFFTISIILYYTGSALAGITAKNRYTILLLPLYAYIAGYFLSAIKKHFKLISAITFTILLIDIVIHTPLGYQSYNNNDYFSNCKRKYTWGFGGYELAQKSNKIPNMNNAKILADYHGFSHFSLGKVQNMDRRITNNYIKQFDYLCLSSSGLSQKKRWKMTTVPLLEYYNQSLDSAIATIGSEGCGYWKLVKVDKTKTDLTIPNTFDPEVYLDLSKPYSIAFWVAARNENPGSPIFIGKNYQSGISVESYKENDNKGLLFRYEENIEASGIYSGNINDSKWHHVVWYQSGGSKGSEFGLYIDGIMKESKILKNDKTDITKFFISKLFAGMMQDIKIYDFALSEQQVKVVFENQDANKKVLYVEENNFEPVQNYIFQIPYRNPKYKKPSKK